MHMNRRSSQGGFTLIEILVTAFILLIALVGVLGLQAKASTTELESYQRGQALSLVRDMASRISSARGLVATNSGYLDGTLSSADGSVYFGVAGSGTTSLGTCVAPSSGSNALQVATYQTCEWAEAVRGVAESGNAGSMLGARACLIRNTAPAGALADIYVVLVWQGVVKGKEPIGMETGEPATPMSMCASSVNYGTGMRRGVSMRVLIPNLS